MVLAHAVEVFASSSSSSSSEFEVGILGIPVVVAVAFWLFTYHRYRNQDARFKFEQTAAQVTNLRSQDARVHHRTGLKSSTIQGRNDDDAAAPVPVARLWEDPPITH